MQVVVCVNSLFLALMRNIPWYGFNGLFNNSLIEEHLGYFQFGAIMNNAVMNICVYFLVKVWLFSDSAVLLHTGDIIAP